MDRLIVASVIPGAATCMAAGSTGWLYVIDQAKGSNASGLSAMGTYLSAGPAGVSLQVVDGKLRLTTTTLDGGVTVLSGGDNPATPGGGGFKRASWRELINN